MASHWAALALAEVFILIVAGESNKLGWEDELGDKADVFGPLEDGKINKLVDKLGLLLLHLP